MKRRFNNPFKVEGNWFKGNVHMHTTNSDGTKTPEELIDIYVDTGYDFISFTDHGIVMDTKGLDSKGLLFIPGEELCIGMSEAGQFHHIVALGVDETLPFKDFDYDMDPQKVIDHINKVGGIPILAHPNWSGLNHSDIMKLRDYHGIEIYNTTCDYCRNIGASGSHIDGVIAAGLEPFIYATDDHHGEVKPFFPLDAGVAWINVKAESLTVTSIMDALRKGHFYSSNGPEIKDITIEEDGLIKVECSPAKYISFVSTPSLGEKHHAMGEPLRRAEYAGRPGETYVRIEVIDYQGRIAWSNPIYNA